MDDGGHAAASGKLRRRPSRWVDYFLGVLIVLSLAALAAYVLLPGSTETHEGGEIRRIVLMRPAVRSGVGWWALASFIALLAGGVLGLVRRRIALPLVALGVALILFPVACLLQIISWGADWTVHDRLTAPDGTTYAFLDYSFLQGQTMALTRTGRSGALRSTFQVLGTNNGDWPQSWAPVVRPADQAHDGYGQLYLSEAGMLVGIRHHNCCFIAYDMRTGRFYGHGDVEDISPFVLIGPSTKMHRPDVDAILSPNKPAGGPVSGYPKPQRVREALSHPNSEVRRAAQEILDAMPTASGGEPASSIR